MRKVYDKDTITARELYKQLSFKEKCKHFWMYNKKIFYGVFLGLVFVGIICIISPEPAPEGNLNIKFINAYMAGLFEENNFIESDYDMYLEDDDACQMVFSYSEISEEGGAQSGSNMEDMMIEVVASNLDICVVDEFALGKVCPAGFVQDVNSYLDGNMLAQIQERLVYWEDMDGNSVPMAIDISNTSYVKAAGIQGDGIYVCFVSNSANPEIAKEFVTYMLSYQNGL